MSLELFKNLLEDFKKEFEVLNTNHGHECLDRPGETIKAVLIARMWG